MFAKKVLIIALLAGAAVSGTARADDPALGAIVGGVVGATIGHSISGRNGAVVGGVLGAATGASIANSNNTYRNQYSSGYDDGRYYDSGVQGRVVVGSPGYYAPPVVYAPPPRVFYAPPPVYYAPPPVVYRDGYGRDEWRHRYHRDWRDDRRWDRDDDHDWRRGR